MNNSSSQDAPGPQTAPAAAQEAVRATAGAELKNRTHSTENNDAQRPRAKAVRVLFILLGLLTFALGTLGVVLPLLPTTPFYLLSLFCLARGSRRLHSWFMGTALYRRYIESYLRDRGMTIRTKLSIMLSFSLLIAISLFFMRNNLLACVILGIVWVGHSIYLFGRVRTIEDEDKDRDKTNDA